MYLFTTGADELLLDELDELELVDELVLLEELLPEELELLLEELLSDVEAELLEEPEGPSELELVCELWLVPLDGLVEDELLLEEVSSPPPLQPAMTNPHKARQARITFLFIYISFLSDSDINIRI